LATEVKLNLGDAEEIVVIREIQRDAMDEQILHIDFQRVN
jgi:ribosomal protein L25 (general stress protein Ctc)